MALKTPARVFRKSFPSGTSKTIDFAEAGFTTPLDNTHLILAFIFVASTTVATFPASWTAIYGGSTGNGPTQLRLIAMQGDGSTNSLTIGTANAIGSITLVAYPDFAGLTPITAAVSTNVTTATSTYSLPDFGSGTANGILFDVIGGPATFVGATYNRGTLVGDLDANGQMILAQEYTDGTADQSVTVTMPSARQGRYSQVVMPIGVGSAPADATMTATPTDAAADGGSALFTVAAASGTMTATPAGDVRAGVSDGWPETWPDAFGPVPAYMTGAALVAVTLSDAAADGGSALFVGAASVSIVTASADATADGGTVTLAGAASAIIVATPTDATADGGTVTLAGAAVGTLSAGQGDGFADGGSALLIGAAAATIFATTADASAAGVDASLLGAAAGTVATVVGNAPADGGSALLVGGAASTLTTIPGDTTASGADAGIVGGSAATLVTLATDAAAEGAVAILSSPGSLAITASDAAASGGTVILAGSAGGMIPVTAADAAGSGGLAALTAGRVVEVIGAHSFVIQPWAGGAGHDVALHKRRAYAEITGRPLSRGRADGMTGPDVELVGDDIARVTYTLTR